MAVGALLHIGVGALPNQQNLTIWGSRPVTLERIVAIMDVADRSNGSMSLACANKLFSIAQHVYCR